MLFGLGIDALLWKSFVFLLALKAPPITDHRVSCLYKQALAYLNLLLLVFRLVMSWVCSFSSKGCERADAFLCQSVFSRPVWHARRRWTAAMLLGWQSVT